MNPWNLNLLGGLSLTRDDIVIDQFPTRRAAMILARLALSRNGSVGRDELAEEFWPEDYLDTTRLRLRQELKRLRGALGDAKDLIDADRTWIRLDLEQVTVDAREFKHHHAQARVAEVARKIDLLERICGLYQGPLLPEFIEHWVFAARLDLREKFEESLSEYVAILSDANEHSKVLEVASRGLQFNPDNEFLATSLTKAQMASRAVGSAKKAVDSDEDEKGSSDSANATVSPGVGARSSTNTEAVEIETESTDLPNYFDAFVGRNAENDLVWQLLNSNARCISIVGPGGVGKTRLSTEIASRYRQKNPRVHFVSMEEVPGSHLKDRISDLVRPEKSALLILDNAESDIDAAAQAVVNLLRTSAVQVLITSRQRLGISGERAVELSPIPTPMDVDDWEALLENPSIELFLDRARAHDPAFDLSRGDAVDVIALMQRLEGLPLAIELAAARAANVGLKELAGKLDSLFTVLVTKRRDVPARQRSLWATIDWSYQTLHEDSKEALKLLSLCPGGCGLEVAEAVLGDSAAEQFDELKDRSLVVTNRIEDGRTRYRLLEPIREFVASAIEPEEHDRYLRSYAVHLADRLNEIGKDIYGPNEGMAFAEKGREFDNVMMLMDWGLKNDLSLTFQMGTLMWRYWCHMGHRNEGHQMMMRALSQPDAPVDNYYSLCLFAAAYTAYLMGRIDESDELFLKSLEVHLKLGLTTRANWITLNRTAIADERGEFEEMYRLAETSLAGFRVSQEQLGLALATADMSLAASLLGNFDLAQELVEESITYRLQMDSPVEIARGFVDKGRIAYEKGDLDEAVKFLEKPITEFERTKQLSLQFHCFQYLAYTHIDARNWDEASSAVGSVRRLEDRVGVLQDGAWCNRVEALIENGRSRKTEARAKLVQALQVSIRDQYERGLVEGCIAAAIVLKSAGENARCSEIVGAIRARQTEGYGIRPSRLRWLEDLPSREVTNPMDWTKLASKALQFLI